jgi:magnesium transporter
VSGDDVNTLEEARRRLRDAVNRPDGRDGDGGLEDVIGDCAVYEQGARQGARVPLEEAGDVARRTSGFVWIGLQRPRAEDLAKVAAEFNLPALAVEDAVKAHQRPKLELYDDIVFVVLRPVRYVDSHEIVEVEEIAIFLGAHFVVSVRHGRTAVLRQVRKELDGGNFPSSLHGPTAVLHRAADLCADQYMDVAASIDDDVAEIEAQVFGQGDANRDHTERIYKLKREVLEFRRAVLPLAEPTHKLMDGNVPGIDPDSRPYFRDVHDHVLRAAEEIERHDRLLSDILQANVAQLSVEQNAVAVRQNEDMRRISAWAAIALVPTAIAGIYGMNFDNMPELKWHYGYFIILGVIVSFCAILYRLFRRNGWL